MSRGKPLGEASREVDAIGRDASPAERMAHLNRVLRVDLSGHPITNVTVDGHEETSSIVLVRPGARNIVFPGSAAMLNPTRLQGIVGAVLRRTVPLFKKDQVGHIADLIWSLSTLRNIYDSVESAADWGRAYLYAAAATEPILDDVGVDVDGRRLWSVFSSLKVEEKMGRAWVVPWHDGARLVIRPWFHRHIQDDLGHEALSEQRIASLMAQAGWRELPRARSALTAHDPDAHSRTLQLRFYVVPEGWEPSLDGGEEAPC